MSAKQNIEIRTSVGTHLKRLREEKSLSIAEVSARLYLQDHIVEALERDAHDNLPASTYVYGYLQNYARLLGTPVDPILAMYKEDIMQQPPPVPEVPPEPKQTSRWSYTILYLFIFISILLLFAWWRSHYALEPTATAGASGNEFRGSAATPLDLPQPITTVEHPDVPSSEAADTEQPVPAQTPGIQVATADKELGTATAAYHENTITSGIGPDSIRIVLTETCWIEVFDADNEKVFYNLARPGQILVLNGIAPFSVLLGYAAAATVEFNSTPFDTTPYRSSIGMARFVVGEDQTGP